MSRITHRSGSEAVQLTLRPRRERLLQPQQQPRRSLGPAVKELLDHLIRCTPMCDTIARTRCQRAVDFQLREACNKFRLKAWIALGRGELSFDLNLRQSLQT